VSKSIRPRHNIALWEYNQSDNGWLF